MHSESLYVEQLVRTPDVVWDLCADLSPEQWRWVPLRGGWSLHDVVCHLYDEERDDFRARLRSTLEDPEVQWAPIDPEGWVASRDYAGRDSSEYLERFIDERRESLEWLDTLESPAWTNTYRQDNRNITAGDLLAAWSAHDLHHIRQISRLQLEYLEHNAPHSPEYAT